MLPQKFRRASLFYQEKTNALRGKKVFPLSEIYLQQSVCRKSPARRSHPFSSLVSNEFCKRNIRKPAAKSLEKTSASARPRVRTILRAKGGARLRFTKYGSRCDAFGGARLQ